MQGTRTLRQHNVMRPSDKTESALQLNTIVQGP